MLSNYPDGTWEGDPHAPWNQDDPPCCECLENKKGDELDGTWNNCPWCGAPIDWNRWDDYEGEWR